MSKAWWGYELLIVYEPIDLPECYKDASSSSPEAIRVFAALNRAVHELWTKFVEAREAPWQNFTLTVSEDGKFSLDLDYENFDKNPAGAVKWRMDWEKKYLGHLKRVE